MIISYSKKYDIFDDIYIYILIILMIYIKIEILKLIVKHLEN